VIGNLGIHFLSFGVVVGLQLLPSGGLLLEFMNLFFRTGSLTAAARRIVELIANAELT